MITIGKVTPKQRVHHVSNISMKQLANHKVTIEMSHNSLCLDFKDDKGNLHSVSLYGSDLIALKELLKQ